MMPHCSTCGYVVEWVRRCKRSKWRLSADNPDALTEGRYVFAPEGTPHYPGFHYLGSRDWVSDNGPRVLGEWDGPYKWQDGQAPDPFPSPIVLGDMSDIANGTCGGVPLVGRPPCNNVVDYLPTLWLTFLAAPSPHEALVGTWWALSDGTPPTGLWLAIITGLGQVEVQCVGGANNDWLIDGIPFSGIELARSDSWSRPLRLRWTVNDVWEVEARANPDPLPAPVELRDGFPLACYQPAPPRPLLDIGDLVTQVALADCLTLTYTDIDAAAAALQTLMGPLATISKVANGSALVPGTVLGKTSDIVILVVSGTTTPEQLALQILYATQGLSDVGPYRTNLVWWGTVGDLHNRLGTAGVNPALPIIIVGHSYGGACASLIAADYLRFRPNANVQLLTFGAPKPGDDQVRAILLAARQIHYANEGDPVPALPPDVGQIPAIFGIVPRILLNDWIAWRALRNHRLLAVDGTITETGPLPLPLDQLAAAALAAVGVLPFPDFAAHAVSEYFARLSQAIA